MRTIRFFRIVTRDLNIGTLLEAGIYESRGLSGGEKPIVHLNGFHSYRQY